MQSEITKQLNEADEAPFAPDARDHVVAELLEAIAADRSEAVRERPGDAAIDTTAVCQPPAHDRDSCCRLD